MEIFTTVAVIYFVIALPLTLITSAVENRIIRSSTIGAPPPRGGWRTLLPGNGSKRTIVGAPPTAETTQARAGTTAGALS
jgi:polar amino acid transport system permease protein